MREVDDDALETVRNGHIVCLVLFEQERPWSAWFRSCSMPLEPTHCNGVVLLLSFLIACGSIRSKGHSTVARLLGRM